MEEEAGGDVHRRNAHGLETTGPLAPLAIEVDMLGGNGVLRSVVAQLVFEGTTAILDYMNHILFRKQFKHLEDARLIHQKAQRGL